MNARIYNLSSDSEEIWSKNISELKIEGILSDQDDDFADDKLIGKGNPIIRLSEIDLASHELNYAVKIYNNTTNEVVCEKQDVLKENSISFVGCNIPNNNTLKIRINVIGNSINKNLEEFLFEKRLPVLNELNSKLLPGESIDLTPVIGGYPGFSGNDFGLGFLDVNTLLLQIPVGSLPSLSAKSITIKDSKNQEVITKVEWKGFQNKFSNYSQYNGAQTYYPYQLVEVGSDLYIAGVFGDNYIVGHNPTGVSILKSTNSGVSWVEVSSIHASSGVDTKLIHFSRKNGMFYLVMYNDSLSINNNESFIYTSSDLASGWQLRKVLSNNGGRFLIKDALILDTDNLFFVGQSKIGSSGTTDAIVGKCSLLNWDCIIVNRNIGTIDDQSYFSSIAADSFGNLYIVGRHYYLPNTSNYIVKKSVDLGQTWNELYNSPSSVDISKVAVTANGQNILITGGAPIAVAYESVNGGAAWNSSNTSCGWEVTGIVIDGSGNSFISCYSFSMGVFTWYLKKKNLGSNVWSTLTSAVNLNLPMTIYKLDSGKIVSAFPGIGLLKTTIDSGVSWQDLTVTGLSSTPLNTNLTDFYHDQSSGEAIAIGNDSQDFSYTTSGVVYSSFDNGVTWGNSLSVGIPTKFNSFGKSLTTNNYFIGGSNGAMEFSANWIVFKRVGAVWNTSESHVPAGSVGSSVKKLVFDTSGNIYALGNYSTSGIGRGYIRKSANDGVSWSTLEDYIYAAGYTTQYLSGTMNGTNLYVVGYGVDSSSNSHWLVRKYNQSVWSIEDDETFSTISGSNATAIDIVFNNAGDMFVLGKYSSVGSKLMHLVVKRKKIGGIWEVISDFSVPNKSVEPSSIFVDSQGIVYVAGKVDNDNGSQESIVRVFKNEKWFTTDNFATDKVSTINKVSNCFNNQICLVGYDYNLVPNKSKKGFVRVLSQ